MADSAMPNARPIDPRWGAWSCAIRNEVSRQVTGSGLPGDLRESVTEHLETTGRFAVLDRPNPVSLLPVAAYDAAGGACLDAGIAAGAAFEFLQCAADILDDWMDGDVSPERSDDGCNVHSVVTYSALLVLSSHTLCSIPGTNAVPAILVRNAIAALTSLELRALGGQQIDASSGGKVRLDLAQSLSVTVLKSGSLGRCGALIGASLATEVVEVQEILGEFGSQVATIHQLMNDISAVWPGGPASRDIADRKNTLPLVFAATTAAMRAEPALSDIPGEERYIRESVLRSGAVHYAWTQAAICRAAALKSNQLLGQLRSGVDLSWLL